MDKLTKAFAIPRFKPEQWDFLRKTATDPEVLGEDYDAWRQNEEGRVQDLEAQDIHVEQVVVDAYELLDWCKKNGLACDAAARSRFAAEVLHREHEGA
jgi:hypothetical protein